MDGITTTSLTPTEIHRLICEALSAAIGIGQSLDILHVAEGLALVFGDQDSALELRCSVRTLEGARAELISAADKLSQFEHE